MYKKNILVSAGVALLMVVLGFVFFGRPSPQIIKEVSPQVIREVVKEIEKLGATPGGDFYTPVNLRDRLTRSPRTRATSTGPTAAGTTLNQNDLLNADMNFVVVGGAVNTNATYTLPASTTLTDFVNRPGESERKCWYNIASSTSVHRLVFAAGTGIDLQMASTTNAIAVPAVLGPAEMNFACIDFVRQARDNAATSDGVSTQGGDISAILEMTSDAD